MRCLKLGFVYFVNHVTNQCNPINGQAEEVLGIAFGVVPNAFNEEMLLFVRPS